MKNDRSISKMILNHAPFLNELKVLSESADVELSRSRLSIFTSNSLLLKQPIGNIMKVRNNDLRSNALPSSVARRSLAHYQSRPPMRQQSLLISTMTAGMTLSLAT